MEFVEKTKIRGNMVNYEKYLREKDLSEISIKKYLGDIMRFLKYLEEKGYSEVSIGTMEHYRKFIYENYSARTYNSYFISLNAYFRFLKRDYLHVKLRRTIQKQSLENVITVEEYNQLLDYTRNTRYQVIHSIIRTLGCTGIRVGELKYVTVEAVRKGRAEVSSKNKTRMVYFSDSLTMELMGYCQQREIGGGIIFRTKKSGRPIESGNIWKRMKLVAKRAGVDVKKVFPHNFRHLFAKTYIEKFNALDELADLLGHSSIETTRIYTRTTGEEKRKRLNMLDL